MADIGYIALVLGLIVCICSAVASIWGKRRNHPKLTSRAQNGVFVAFGLVTLAAIVLIYALQTHDFRIEYVARFCYGVGFSLSSQWLWYCGKESLPGS